MTTVDDACVVINHYACADGAHYFEQWIDGQLGFREVNGPDHGLGQSVNSAGAGWVAVDEVVAPFSLSQLLATGVASGSYRVEVVKMFPVPRPATVQIDATLTGTVREVSGVTLRVAHIVLNERVDTGGLVSRLDGLLLVDELRDVMIVDYETVTVAGVAQPSRGDLSQIILSGQDGFMTTAAPACQGLLSLATPQPEPSHG